MHGDETDVPRKFSIWIRRSELRDAVQLMEIDALAWTSRTSPSPIKWASREQYLRNCPPGGQLVAVIGERVCGYLGFAAPTAMPCHRHVYEIHVAIHPAYRRLGIGSSLMAAMKELAAEEGIRKLSLRVLSTNPCAVAFYESCGFMMQGRLIAEYCIEGEYVDDILMWCPVIPPASDSK
ncbi:GNAT family N-acetyltransferase [Paenibacillus woosongensis]|uniref:GNAT family N-acetyltransferase n=1 Tax=Paenibacillus woosongensis TaxID=307580 RepID=A0AA95KVR1_9BACL|nr:GNAT family N-acetyltransferase [Paenibacillus woosongensis]WHX48805.1 GNAT family N-acetyltransferase [Paenibacillus woosongensis]